MNDDATPTFLDNFADVVTQLARQVEAARAIKDSLAQNLDFIKGKQVDQGPTQAVDLYPVSHGIVHSYHDVDALTTQLREAVTESIDLVNQLGDVRRSIAYAFAETTRQTNTGLCLLSSLIEFAFQGGKYEGISNFKPLPIDEYTAPGEGNDYARRNLISLYKIINGLQLTLELDVTPLEANLD